MYTLEEIAALRQKCAILKLDGREKLNEYTDEELQSICNGIGPRALPRFLRKTLNKLHPALEPAALIHDIDFERSDGTKEGFDRANARFLANGLRGALSCAWYDLRRYLAMFHAFRLALCCRHFGGIFWQLAARRNASAKEL